MIKSAKKQFLCKASCTDQSEGFDRQHIQSANLNSGTNLDYKVQPSKQINAKKRWLCIKSSEKMNQKYSQLKCLHFQRNVYSEMYKSLISWIIWFLYSELQVRNSKLKLVRLIRLKSRLSSLSFLKFVLSSFFKIIVYFFHVLNHSLNRKKGSF